MNLRGQNEAAMNRAGAQQAADRIRRLREELASKEIQSILTLTADQQSRFEEWSLAKLSVLAQQFDIDTTQSQKSMSWGMRIASTLGGLALCAATVLLFIRYWGFLDTAIQVVLVVLTPLLLLAVTEYAARREQAPYFTGLLALVTLASFILNLTILGDVFNVISTERALLPWGVFALALAYRYGLRLLLVSGLLLSMAYVAAACTAQMGYLWLNFYDRPENLLVLGLLVFTIPLYWKHSENPDFPSVYRLIGSLTLLLAIFSLSEWGASSYLPWEVTNIERFYEITGLIVSTAAIWWSITRNWNGVVNVGATFFVIFLFTRLYHMWWDWMPRYLFFAVIGALGIGIVFAFKGLRSRMMHLETPLVA